MSTALTFEERLGRLDREVEELKTLFVDVLDHIRSTPEADGSFEDRWQALATRLKGLRTAVAAEDYDKEQLATLTTALLDMRDLLDMPDARGDLEVCDQLLIALARVRHVVRDALDEHVDGVADDIGSLMAELAQWLPDVPDRTLAELVGVDRRTLSRWRRQAGRPQRRVRTFARVVAILRHNWDQEGIIDWFGRPRRDLGGRTPASLLSEPNAESDLVNAARGGRSQYAT